MSSSIRTTPDRWFYFGLITLVLWFITYLGMAEYARWQREHYMYFTDGDMLMRYLRILDLVETGDWYNNFIRRDNYPHGNLIPWTRLFDFLILGPAYLFKSVAALSWKNAIFWSGTIISPVLFLIASCGFLWATIPLRLREYEVLVALLFFVLNPYILNTFAFGRGDHHSLLCCLFVFGLGYGLRLVEQNESRKYQLLLIVVLALGLWVSAEFMAVIFFCMLPLAVLYAMGNISAAQTIRNLASGLLALLIPLILIEKPPSDFFLVENDRISIVHVALFVMVTLLTWGALKLQPVLHDTKKRILAMCAAFALLFTVMNLLFPRFYLGPLAAYTSEQVKLWLPNIAETFDIRYIGDQIILFCCVVLGMSYFGLYTAYTKKEVSLPGVLFLSGFLLGFALLFALALRWNYYIMPALAMGGALFLHYISETIHRVRQRYKQAIAHVLLAVFLGVVLYLPYYTGLNHMTGRGVVHGYYDDCETASLYMIENNAFGRNINFDNVVVMSVDNVTPWLLFWTGARTIGSNYTRNVEGMIDAVTFYRTQDAAVFSDILKRRKVRYILACRRDNPDEKSQITHLIRGDKRYAQWQRMPYKKPALKLFKKPLPDAYYPLVFRRRD